MPRYDKYEPYANGFRAPLAADWLRADAIVGRAFGVGFNASGQLVKGAGNTGIMGVLVLTQAEQLSTPKHRAGSWVDVMTSGDIVEWATSADVAGVAGTNYYVVAATGLIVAGGAAAASGQVYLGTTCEVSTKTGARLIVRYSKVPAAA